MKLDIHLKIIVSLIVLITLVSCNQIDKPPIAIDSSYVNNQIILRIAPFLNTFKTTDSIALELKYNSLNKIVFPNNYNLKIFYKTNQEWVEIKEKPTQRFPEGDITFAPNISMPIAEAVFVYPDLPSLTDQYTLRIYVIGDMYSESGTNKVAAFVDIKLLP